MENNKNLISTEDKPKEKFLNQDIYTISDSDLLCLVMNPNCKYEEEINDYNNILNEVGELANFNNFSYDDLKKLKKVNSLDAIRLLSSIELGRRIYYNYQQKKIKLDSPDRVYEYMKSELLDKYQEYFFALYLDNKKNLIEKKLLFIGTLNMTISSAREIFENAYLLNASSIICVHNHPSGDSFPSSNDIQFTTQLSKIAYIHNIKINDHIIIGEKYYSFYEDGKLDDSRINKSINKCY